METRLLTTLTSLAKSGDKDAQMELIRRFLPLMKKYVRKCHTMEPEDTLQEFTLSLLNAVHEMKYITNEASTVLFFKQTIINHYKYLCKKSFLLSQREDIKDDTFFILLKDPGTPYADTDFRLSMNEYIKVLPEMQGKILKCILDGTESDIEIAQQLHVSRQYINRIKKTLLNKKETESPI